MAEKKNHSNFNFDFCHDITVLSQKIITSRLDELQSVSEFILSKHWEQRGLGITTHGLSSLFTKTGFPLSCQTEL